MRLVRGLCILGMAGLVTSACTEAASGGERAADSGPGGDVIGDLGGVPVRIPWEFANNVVYDKEPASPPSASTGAARLRSFGFEFRYPDMIGLGSEEARKDRRAHLPGNTYWILAGLSLGEDYPGAGATERLTLATLGRREAATGAMYQPAADKTCGLETYTLAGTDATSGKPHREHPHAEDVFVGRDAAGRATTFIRCSNRALHAAACRQVFELEPQMQAWVHLGYRRGLLCEWRGIQGATAQLLYSFKKTADLGCASGTASSPSN